MCGRFVTNFSSEELVSYLQETTSRTVHTEAEVFAEPKFNAAPTHMLPVCWTHEESLRIDRFKWGLVPKWSKDPSIGSKMINARVETVHEKPSFRGLVKGHRCVVPMRGFYEWLRPESGPKRPFFVTRDDNAPLMVAGLWTESPVLGDVRTFCTLTTESTGRLANIHHRSPVVLEPEEIEEWLTSENPLPLARQTPRSDLALLEVSTRVNSVRNDDEHLIDPVDDGRLFS